MSVLGPSNIRLGELIAEVEWQTSSVNNTVTIEPHSIRLLLRRQYGNNEPVVIGEMQWAADNDESAEQ